MWPSPEHVASARIVLVSSSGAWLHQMSFCSLPGAQPQEGKGCRSPWSPLQVQTLLRLHGDTGLRMQTDLSLTPGLPLPSRVTLGDSHDVPAEPQVLPGPGRVLTARVSEVNVKVGEGTQGGAG